MKKWKNWLMWILVGLNCTLLVVQGMVSSLIDILALSILLYSLYLLGKILIPKWAEKDLFFSSPKLGRIKARRRSGRIIGFLGNLVGKKVHVDKKTGKIKLGENNPTGFWWKLFGVRLIGLDDVYTYKIVREAVEGDDGKFVHTEEPASSIYYEGTYPVTALLYTADGVLLRVKLRIKTTTRNAAKALSLPVSWTVPMFEAVVAACRDHFGLRKTRDLISAQNEGGKMTVYGNNIENSGFIKLIQSLNEAEEGNISLEDVCGQFIDAVNVVDVDFATDKDKEIFMRPFTSEQDAQKEIKDAEAYATALKLRTDADKAAATATASAILEKGKAEAEVYGLKHKATGEKPSATAQVLAAERHSTMPKLTTLVVGGGQALVSVAEEKGE